MLKTELKMDCEVRAEGGFKKTKKVNKRWLGGGKMVVLCLQSHG